LLLSFWTSGNLCYLFFGICFCQVENDFILSCRNEVACAGTTDYKHAACHIWVGPNASLRQRLVLSDLWDRILRNTCLGTEYIHVIQLVVKAMNTIDVMHRSPMLSCQGRQAWRDCRLQIENHSRQTVGHQLYNHVASGLA
jgi:hypothetical protein